MKGLLPVVPCYVQIPITDDYAEKYWFCAPWHAPLIMGGNTLYGGISTIFIFGMYMKGLAPYMDYHTYLSSLPIQLNIAAPQAAIGEVHIGEGSCTSHGTAMVTGGAGGTIGIGPLGT